MHTTTRTHHASFHEHMKVKTSSNAHTVRYCVTLGCGVLWLNTCTVKERVSAADWCRQITGLRVRHVNWIVDYDSPILSIG